VTDVHKSDISWTAKVNNPSDMSRRAHVEAIILSINHDEKKVSLGVKQLWTTRGPRSSMSYLRARWSDQVISIVDYGVFVHIATASKGCRPEDLVLAKDDSGEDRSSVGTAEAEIANMDSQERRITLSMRRARSHRDARRGKRRRHVRRSPPRRPRRRGGCRRKRSGSSSSKAWKQARLDQTTRKTTRPRTTRPRTTETKESQDE